MATSRTAAPPTTSEAFAGPENALELARWRQVHEVRALRDTLAIYRRCAAALAAENAMLHEQLSNLSGRAMGTDGRMSSRTRGDCGGTAPRSDPN